MTRPVSFIATALLVVGCEPHTADLGLWDGDAPVLVRSYIAPEDRPQTPEARRALHEAGRAALMETEDIFQTAASWAEADRRLRVLIDQQEGPLYRRRFEEAAAARMLRLDGLQRSDAPEALETSGHYAQMLVRHGSPDTPLLADAISRLVRHRSPDTPLLADAISRLDGHWSADRVAEVASGALRAAEAYAARGETCHDCRSGDASSPTPSEVVATSASQGTFGAEVAQAVRRLQALAARS